MSGSRLGADRKPLCDSGRFDGDAEGGSEGLARLKRLQAVAADERVGRRGHRLEADQRLAPGSVDLGVRVAVVERDLDLTAAAAQLERAPHAAVAVVVGAVLQRAGVLVGLLGLAGG